MSFFNWLRSAAPPSDGKSSKRLFPAPHLELEMLERRDLMSVSLDASGLLTVRGDAGVSDDTISIQYFRYHFAYGGARIEVIQNGQSFSRPAGDVHAVAILAGPGNDTIEVNNSGGIGVDVTIDGEAGDDTVIITRMPPGILDTYGWLGGNLTISGGAATRWFDTDSLIFRGPLQASSFVVSDVTVQVDVTGQGTGRVDYADFERLVIGGDDDFYLGNQTYFIQSTNQLTPLELTPALAAQIHLGNDTSGLGSILSSVTIQGGGSRTAAQHLFIHDDASYLGRSYTITDRSVSRSGAALITYTDLNSVQLDATNEDDTIDIVPTGAASVAFNMQINTGDGDDIVNVGASANTLDGLRGELTITAGAGFHQLNIMDQATSAAKYYTLTADAVSRSSSILPLASPNIIYEQMDKVTIHTGSGDDVLTVAATPAAPRVEVNGGNGSDILVGPALANTWQISRHDGGYLNDLVYDAIEHLRGNSQDDRFLFWPAGQVSGTLDGDLGSDTLDYGPYNFFRSVASGVMVDLTRGLATSVHSQVAGHVFNFENVTGSSGNDTITGTNGCDILLGGPGNDRINGGGGRDLLIGGSGADQINGGAGDDLLIDGTTTFDSDEAALRAIALAWARADRTYTQRSADLRAGVGPCKIYKLDSTTVVSDSDVDTLTGGADRDWFWAVTLTAKTRDTLIDWAGNYVDPFGPDTSERVK